MDDREVDDICKRLSAVVNHVPGKGHKMKENIWVEYENGRSRVREEETLKKVSKPIIVEDDEDQEHGEELGDLSKFELATVYEDLIKSEMEKSHLEEQIGKMSVKIREVEIKLMAAREEATVREEEWKKAVTETDMLQNDNQKMGKRCEKLEADYRVLEEQHKELIDEHSRQNPELHQTLRMENIKLREELQSCENRKKMLEKEVQEMEEELRKKQNILDEEIQGRIKQHEENIHLSQMVSRLRTETDQMDNLKDRLDTAQNEMNALKHMEEEKISNYKEMQRDLVVHQKQYQECSSQLEAQRRQNEVSDPL